MGVDFRPLNNEETIHWWITLGSTCLLLVPGQSWLSFNLPKGGFIQLLWIIFPFPSGESAPMCDCCNLCILFFA